MAHAMLIALLEEAYRRPAWHGPNLTGALRGVTWDLALWRPRRDRHCIWELTLHCAYWKHVVRERLTGVREPFPRSGVDWPNLPAKPDAAAWRADRRLLSRCHAALLSAARAVPATGLNRSARGHRQTPRQLLVGVALHDTYHAGQVRALVRLAAGRA